jgi:sodium-dependent phosphate cotransporter
VSVRLVDLALPEAADAAHLEEHTDWRSRKWTMFAVGSLVALVTMSVSVALTLLVPAMVKGYIGRRHVVPYILGANITTLGDTLLVALLLGAPGAPQVVLAELIGVSLITLVLMLFFYHPLQRFTLWLAEHLAANPRLLIAVLAVLSIIPIVLILLF